MRTKEEFLHLLEAHQIQILVDVRRFPGSNRFPQFNSDRLRRFLKKHGIRYLHFPDLGGRRTALKNSVNLGWQVAAFRGYADYMEKDPFKESLERLILLDKKKRVVVMCAEAVPWRCHRRLIADAMVARGLPVFDIMTKTRAVPHQLPSWARVKSEKLSYPGEAMKRAA
ncbi:MAG: DUF488 domain-containing protein [Methylotenera sp.]|nr:DUF488 domain-containing protein [Oligoflexia bacterium]